MDKENLFHTRVTYTLERIDYAVFLGGFCALLFLHEGDVRWIRFLVAFAWIDLLGYIPGALWFRYGVSPGQPMPRAYPLLYNITHSFLTNAIVIVTWLAVQGDWEWAMLAGPIHLCGDRALFGNIYKPFGLSYEPIPHPLFSQLATDFHWNRV